MFHRIYIAKTIEYPTMAANVWVLVPLSAAAMKNSIVQQHEMERAQ
jgi:hypothetical protein